MRTEDIVLGIDLGTTYSAVAYVNEHGKANLISNSLGDKITPSVVMFGDKKDDIIVGQEAKDSAELYPDRVIEFVKREIGKNAIEVRDGKPFSFWGHNYSPEEISSFIIKQLKNDAEEHLGFPVENAVITVPAYFNDYEREATINAAKLAGLNVLRIINEPTAAALFYGYQKTNKNQKAFVFDLGGGTFDITILQINKNEIKVIGTNGDHHLGGKDWDDRILEFITDQFLTEYGVDPLDDQDVKADIRERAEKAKIHLSDRAKTKIIVNAHGKKLAVELSQEKFKDLTSDLLERCNDLCKLVFDECNLNWDEIDEIILAGGSTRMPMVKNMLNLLSKKEIRTDLVNPDECVALGAAIQGEMLKAKTIPDYLSQSNKKYGITLIKDVTTHSLGMIALKDGAFKNSFIIPKNETIPCEKSRNDFVTSYNDQGSLDIYLVQGESENPYHCTILDSYEFYDIPKRAAGATRIEVTFRYNANGVIDVSAVDVSTSKVLPYIRKEKPNLEDLETGISKFLDIGLLIDCSGSMGGRPLTDAKQAAHRFVEKINLNSNQVGLISFGSKAQIRQLLTNKQSSLFKSIASLSTMGSTNMSEALRIARNDLFCYSNNDKVLVMLTDGYPDNLNATLEEGNLVKNNDIRIITIGVGSGVDEKFLKRLATTSEDYHFVNESFELESTFLNIATELASGKIKII